jgi:hypothetical protein
MLDLPELFTPASTVSGRMAIVWRSAIDLYPATEMAVMPELAPFRVRELSAVGQNIATAVNLTG